MRGGWLAGLLCWFLSGLVVGLGLIDLGSTVLCLLD